MATKIESPQSNNNANNRHNSTNRKRHYDDAGDLENRDIRRHDYQQNETTTTTVLNRQQQRQQPTMSQSSSMILGFKRIKTGEQMCKRLIDIRQFDISLEQAQELSRFIDMLPVELEGTIRDILEKCQSIDDAIVELSSLQNVHYNNNNNNNNGDNKNNNNNNNNNTSISHDTNGCESEVVNEARDLAQQDLTSPTRLSFLDGACDRTTSNNNNNNNSNANQTRNNNNNATPATSENRHHNNNMNTQTQQNKNKSLDAAEWVSAIVREMQNASSVGDAELRATNVLRAFEESTREQAELEIKRIRKQNELLKRAVTIQNQRLKQNGDAQTLKRQVAELQSMCQSYEEQLATAQRNNYSLGVHLREAIMNNNGNDPNNNNGGGSSFSANPNRDVF
jgi:hypothetical protein